MQVITKYIEFSTEGKVDIINITVEIENLLSSTLLKEGSVLVFAVGSTCALSTVEYEDGLIFDLRGLFERLAPSGEEYRHNMRWHDGNGHSHLRATLLGASLTVPFVDSKLILGTWQQVVFFEFDNRPRKRKVVLQFCGV